MTWKVKPTCQRHEWQGVSDIYYFVKLNLLARDLLNIGPVNMCLMFLIITLSLRRKTLKDFRGYFFIDFGGGN